MSGAGTKERSEQAIRSQRIDPDPSVANREAEHRARAEGRVLQPDEFTVACAQACPSRAIVFGDAADANWSVAKLAYDRRAYHVFEELNTYTAVVYL